MNGVERILRTADQLQRRRTWLAVPFAVAKKFGDDRAGYLAALIAYYGFFSLFPLLLLFVTVLGLVLGSGSALAARIEASALSQFPVVGSQVQVHSLHGNGIALTVGIVGALWAGLAVMQAAQHAMNEVWYVKRTDRPRFLVSILRSLVMLAFLGAFVIASTLLTGFASGAGGSVVARLLTTLCSLLVNLALYAVAFRVLTRKNLFWRDVMVGAAFGASTWTVLQLVGAFYVRHQVTGATSTYGTFAFVLGLLVWLYLGAQVSLYAAEINVVRKLRMWPRSLVQPPLLATDERTYADAAKAQEQRPGGSDDVAFRGHDVEPLISTAGSGVPLRGRPNRGLASRVPRLLQFLALVVAGIVIGRTWKRG